MTTDKIRFIVIGCGHIGKRHAEMITRDPEAELTGLCDILPQDTLGIDNYPVPFYPHIDEILDNKVAADVINICTPNG